MIGSMPSPARASAAGMSSPPRVRTWAFPDDAQRDVREEHEVYDSQLPVLRRSASSTARRPRRMPCATSGAAPVRQSPRRQSQRHHRPHDFPLDLRPRIPQRGNEFGCIAGFLRDRRGCAAPGRRSRWNRRESGRGRSSDQLRLEAIASRASSTITTDWLRVLSTTSSALTGPIPTTTGVPRTRCIRR